MVSIQPSAVSSQQEKLNADCSAEIDRIDIDLDPRLS